MSNNAEEKEIIDCAREKIEWLGMAWVRVLEKMDFPGKRLFTLNPAIASKAALHYAEDLKFLKKRYAIPDKAQPPRVAGLMTSAILKYRPLVPTSGHELDIHGNEINELFAIWQGLCICANCTTDGKTFSNKAVANFMSHPNFRTWLGRFIFLLKERNYTSESLIMAFETLCQFVVLGYNECNA